jgi:hypothetical protein
LVLFQHDATQLELMVASARVRWRKEASNARNRAFAAGYREAFTEREAFAVNTAVNASL